MLQYFPDTYEKGIQPDRAYTFNVLNTLRGEYVQKIIQNAYEVRNLASEQSQKAEIIRVTPHW